MVFGMRNRHLLTDETVSFFLLASAAKAISHVARIPLVKADV